MEPVQYDSPAQNMSFSAGIPGCGKTREMMEASVREHPKYRQHRTELVVQDAYGQIYLTRQIYRQIVQK